VPTRTRTSPSSFADVEAISHIDITSIGEEVQPAGNQTCRGDSLDVDGPGDQDRVAGSRRNGPQPAMWASRDSRAARVVPLVCCQPVMASRTGRRCPTVPGVESTSAASPDLPDGCRRDICHLRRFPQVIAEDAAYARSTLRSAIARIEAEGFTPVALVYLAWGACARRQDGGGTRPEEMKTPPVFWPQHLAAPAVSRHGVRGAMLVTTAAGRRR